MKANAGVVPVGFGCSRRTQPAHVQGIREKAAEGIRTLDLLHGKRAGRRRIWLCRAKCESRRKLALGRFQGDFALFGQQNGSAAQTIANMDNGESCGWRPAARHPAGRQLQLALRFRPGFLLRWVRAVSARLLLAPGGRLLLVPRLTQPFRSLRWFSFWPVSFSHCGCSRLR
jgi:hypothetical protein